MTIYELNDLQDKWRKKMLIAGEKKWRKPFNLLGL